jgi:hypothetical protein
MNTQHESGSLNGSATLYLMVGEIRSDVKHLRSDVQDVSGRVQRLERTVRRKPEPRAWIQSLTLKDMGGFLFGATILLLAIAGKWGLIGEIVHAFGRSAG